MAITLLNESFFEAKLFEVGLHKASRTYFERDGQIENIVIERSKQTKPGLYNLITLKVDNFIILEINAEHGDSPEELKFSVQHSTNREDLVILKQISVDLLSQGGVLANTQMARAIYETFSAKLDASKVTIH